MRFPRPDERLTVTIEEAARLLGISRSGAYAAARTGALPAVRIGRRYLVPTALLAALVGLDFETSGRTPDPITRPRPFSRRGLPRWP